MNKRSVVHPGPFPDKSGVPVDPSVPVPTTTDPTQALGIANGALALIVFALGIAALAFMFASCRKKHIKSLRYPVRGFGFATAFIFSSLLLGWRMSWVERDGIIVLLVAGCCFLFFALFLVYLYSQELRDIRAKAATVDTTGLAPRSLDPHS